VEEYFALVGVFVNGGMFYLVFSRNKNLKKILIIYSLLYLIPSALSLGSLGWKYLMIGENVDFTYDSINKSFFYFLGSILNLFFVKKCITVQDE
jgi:hypothetical protein